jgi:hypothetical protein
MLLYLISFATFQSYSNEVIFISFQAFNQNYNVIPSHYKNMFKGEGINHLNKNNDKEKNQIIY